MTYQWYDVVGTAGVATIVITYVLLQSDRIRSEQLAYSVLNAIGAALIIVSLCFNFNFPAFIVEFFWLLISLIGVVKYIWLRRSKKLTAERADIR